MFTLTAEYALRAVTVLAFVEGGSATTEQIAERSKIPVSYLSKVLQNLVKAGIVGTRRGIGGGAFLNKPADQLTILEVINAVEPILRYKTCPLGIVSHGSKLCPLHAKLDKALANFEDAFRTTTLADMIHEPTTSVPLCEAPGDARVSLGVRKTVAANSSTTV